MHDRDETAPRSRVGRNGGDPRECASPTAAGAQENRAGNGETQEWEVFRREAIDEPLVHVGSVTAPTAGVGHEQAAALFGDAAGLWLCPVDAVARFAVATLGGER